nr:reverse transcriptase domain-containing protein [Tanacetum cinerariifolium]
MIISPVLWVRPTKENERCQFGVGCFNRPWTDHPEGGLIACLMVAKTVRRTFAKVRVSSPYNIILGRMGMRELGVISSTVHFMVKFLTLRGIATLVTRTTLVYECRWSERQVVKHEEELEVIGYEDLKGSREEKPSDMVGLPRRIIRHALNVNVSVPPLAQKRRCLGMKKNRVVMKEVEEWVKARIVRQVLLVLSLIYHALCDNRSLSWLTARPIVVRHESEKMAWPIMVSNAYVKMAWPSVRLERTYLVNWVSLTRKLVGRRGVSQGTEGGMDVRGIEEEVDSNFLSDAHSRTGPAESGDSCKSK